MRIPFLRSAGAASIRRLDSAWFLGQLRSRLAPSGAKGESPLLVQVLLLAREMGLLKMGTVALDGTNIHANASKHSAPSYEHAGRIEAQLKAEVAELMAKAADKADLPDGLSIPDELRGAGSGSRSLPKLARKSRRAKGGERSNLCPQQLSWPEGLIGEFLYGRGTDVTISVLKGGFGQQALISNLFYSCVPGVAPSLRSDPCKHSLACTLLNVLRGSLH